MENYFDCLSKSRDEILALLKEIDFRCDAFGRQYIADRVKVLKPRPIPKDIVSLSYAEQIGGLKPKTEFRYPNAQGGTSIAKVCSLYDLPKYMVNPFIYCFSGFMMAPLFAFEAMRFYLKQTGRLLPFVSSGKEGNKGVFDKLYHRRDGIICKTEYDSYYKLFAMLAGKAFTYRYYTKCDDKTTADNLVFMHDFAKQRGLSEITLVMVTGNPFYDKRLLAEWLFQLKDEKFKDVKINLVLAHCPISLRRSNVGIPEMRLSEIYLGNIAGAIGPLVKDTIRFNGVTKSLKPERYVMPNVFNAAWIAFREVIVHHSHRGWPEYQEILYGIDHEEAVLNVIVSDLFARASYQPEEYDAGILEIIKEYQAFLGGAYQEKSGSLKLYLKNTPDKRYFCDKSSY